MSASVQVKGESKVAGRANVCIFPDLNTGNNTYKVRAAVAPLNVVLNANPRCLSACHIDMQMGCKPYPAFPSISRIGLLWSNTVDGKCGAHVVDLRFPRDTVK
jgi:hypothetical protein